MNQSTIGKESIFEKENLPKGWIKTELEICIEILDRKRIPINSNERKQRQGTIPYYGATGQVGYIDDYLFDEELVLLGEDGAPFLDHFKTKAYVIKGKSWVNNHAHVLKGVKEILLNEFLCHFLNQFQYHSYVTGTTRLKLNQSRMKNIPITLPPLPEQKRIVTKIESIFAQIDAIRENLERLASQVTSASGSLVQLKSSVLKQAFEGRILPQDPNDEPAEILLKRIHKDSVKELFFEKDDLPKGWIRTDLENISTVILGQSPPSSTYNKEGSGLPFFQGKADFGEFYPTTRVWCDSPKKTAEKNDILISVRAPVGSTNISPETCCIGRGLSAIKTLEVADMSYVFYHLRYLENHISQKGTGTTFKAITGKQLKSIKVSLPPLLEQHRIVSKIESIFARIDANIISMRDKIIHKIYHSFFQIYGHNI